MRALAIVCIVVLAGCMDATPTADPEADGPPRSEWPSSSNDLQGSRYAPDAGIDAGDVPTLGVAWTFETDGAVTGTPTVADDVAYFGTWKGSIYAVDLATGQQRWHREHGSQVDSTVTVWDDHLLVSDMGARLTLLEAATGDAVWEVVVDDTTSAHLYSSPVVWAPGGLVIMAVASDQESIAIHGDQPVDFRGQIVAYDFDGSEVWRTFLVPEGQTGAPVWGGLAVDDERVYFGTGNAYTAPAGNWTDSIMALDAATGRYLWHHQTLNYDVFTQAKPFNPDHDFGSTPSLFMHDGRPLVGIGQKSSIYWAADAATGEIVWTHGESSQGEGIIGDSAHADGRIFALQSTQQIVLALGTDGTESWRRDMPGPLFSDPAVVPGAVIVGDGTGRVEALDWQNGRSIWNASVDGGVFGGISVASGHVLVPTVGDGFQGDRAAVVAFAPGGRSDGGAGTTEGSGAVELRDFQFVPAQIEVAVGDTVTWLNADGIFHTATSGWDNGTTFDFVLAASGDTAEWTFEAPGTYTVYCQPHAAYDGRWQGMVGTVIVS